MAQATVAGGAAAGISRRTLFRWALLGSVGAVAASMGVGFIAFFYPKKTGAFGGVVSAGNLSDFPEGTVNRVAKGKFYLVHDKPGLLALFWRCRHLGCTVPWNPTETFTTAAGQQVTGVFHCPCHGSLYTRDGQIQAGPAPGPLDLMKMTVGQDGLINVDTGAIRRRPHARDSHFIPAQPGASGPDAPDLQPHGTEI